ncbi:uncharacterized protein DEA37_0010707 [Paragonimus westermani]|uniref:Uncharacterized protein n=1 Tax=Paragonimus westermani TaxID=34504 RepID=A0A5J4N984_9TREM|nr:uncharacterized protein DEA37_0010707 [Paragonimus westermani]
MVFAGTYLKSNYAEQFDPRLLAVIPPLIGLKGNLEVTLSSRLATMIQGVSAAVVISLICVTLYSCSDITEFTDHGFLHLTTVSTLTCIIAICALTPNFIIAVTFASMTVIFIAGPYYLKRDSVSSLCSDFHGMAITWLTFRSSVTPLLGAVLMSSLSGQVLAHFAHQLPNLARLQIAINGQSGSSSWLLMSFQLTPCFLLIRFTVSTS